MSDLETQESGRAVSLSCPFANGYKIEFSNRCVVQDSAESPSPYTTIRNVVCRRVGNHFKKTTEISVAGKLIVLEDTYEFVREADDARFCQSACSIAMDTDTKDTKNSEQEGDFTDKGSDRKNVVKNIVKSFAKSLKDQQIDEASLEANRALQHLLRRNKFNNKMVVKLVKSAVLGAPFRKFLEQSAEDWLSNSKIVDKRSTMETIQMYKDLYESGEGIRLRTPKRGHY